jgi:hypothetical protein
MKLWIWVLLIVVAALGGAAFAYGVLMAQLMSMWGHS